MSNQQKFKVFFNEALEYANTLSERECPDYTWVLGKRVGVLGVCDFKKKELSLHVPQLIMNPHCIVDTIRHEVAHAVAGPLARHGWEWRAEAIRLGAKPKSYADTTNNIPHKYELVCSLCGKIVAKKQRKTSSKMFYKRVSGCCRAKFYEREAQQTPMYFSVEPPEFSSLLEKL